MTESQQTELKNTPMIKDALSRSRGFMSMGNREAAVEVLESVQDKLSWQSGVLLNIARSIVDTIYIYICTYCIYIWRFNLMNCCFRSWR